MYSTEEEFVTYSISMKLKELGFNYPCFAFYTNPKRIRRFNDEGTNSDLSVLYGAHAKEIATAPLFSQAFRWFREEHKITHWITDHYCEEFYSYLYEMRHPKIILREDLRILKISASYRDAELECLNRLVELITRKNKTLNYDKKID